MPGNFEDIRYLTPFAVEYRYDIFPEEQTEPLDKLAVKKMIEALRVWAVNLRKKPLVSKLKTFIRRLTQINADFKSNLDKRLDFYIQDIICEIYRNLRIKLLFLRSMFFGFR